MPNETDVDVVVVGAGFSGIYATHRMRNVLGLQVQSFEAGGGPGGTWFWNNYPGARVDFESIYYSFSFDEDLQRDWRWTERFASQPELQAYFEHVMDRFDLGRSYKFNTRVVAMTWTTDGSFWTVETDDGLKMTARYVVSGSGFLSAPKKNEFSGIESFAGEVLYTSDWPKDRLVDLAGKRVAVIGTGSSGLQVIPELAKVVAELTVFQRTPAYGLPLGNGPLPESEMDETIANYPQLREAARSNIAGVPYPPPAHDTALSLSKEDRKALYDTYYGNGGLRIAISTFADLMVNKEANDTLAEYIRDRIRERVSDPAVAEMLTPTEYPYGTKRPPFETNYFEAFNQSNVKLVDVNKAPITAIIPSGLTTYDDEHEFDVLVLATGFDAFTGPLIRMGITGRDGVKLEDYWAQGAKTYLGLMIPNFPNLFIPVGPQSAATHVNNPLGIEFHVEYISDMIQDAESRRAETVEASEDAAQRWASLCAGIADLTLLRDVPAWGWGSNIPGKPRVPLFFVGGAPLFMSIHDDAKAHGWAGVSFDGAPSAVAPSLKLDAAVTLLLSAIESQGGPPVEQMSLTDQRAVLRGFTSLQAPAREDVRCFDVVYPSGGADRAARIYVPEHDGPLPVLVFFHPGGWIAGDIDVSHNPCTELAADLKAVVVSASYRLAPEHPFPAATDDTLAAIRWAANVVGSYGGDPKRIAIAGESAGGTLAAIAARRIRDEGGPDLVAQVLLYPPISPDSRTASYFEFADGPIQTNTFSEVQWSQYLVDPQNRRSPLAAPSAAESLEGLPPALVISMEVDPTRDSIEDYGRALSNAGVKTEIVRFDGLVHASLNLTGVVPRAREIHEAIVQYLGAVYADAS
jgi:cation diffusion facilitator CzcD-associated flavoprotein CzcO/acetyl esterase/lipase